MIKLQQFNALSLKYKRLENNLFSIKITQKEAIFNDEMIALGDNELFRAIRRITNHPYSIDELNNLISIKKSLKKQKNDRENRDKIRKINELISEQMFISEFISVEFSNEKEYNKLNENGFYVNNKKFVWLMCGASHQRTNRAMYVCEDIYDKLDEVLRNGANLNDMVLAKYNAYYALSSSATYKVRFPKVICIPDKEIDMEKLVDFAENETITRCKKTLNFNLFDGQGLISPQFAEKWANDVEIFDYIPSAFGIRCAFIKGMCVTFDFHKFATDIAKSNTIIDIWGNEQNVLEADIILTQSQFKLWNCYKSYEQYENEVKKSGFSWGISKISPKATDEKKYMFTNYQFLQVLDLNDNDIKSICKPTVDWINGVSCGNIDYTQLYLMGKIAQDSDGNNAWSRIQDSFLKGLSINNKLINDEYCKNRIIKSINKKINDSYFGNLIVEGNFMARIADPYALCEHAFGLNVSGLLAENEHYSYYWNEKSVNEVVAMRSPLTYKTEAHKLNLKNNDIVNEWYKYLTSGIVYNVWGVDCLLEGGADYDFDITATTNNEYFLKGIINTNIPVVYDAIKPTKEAIELKKLEKIAGVGFNTLIGYLTNLSTTLYEMQSQYENHSEEWNEIENRLKFCCKLQSMQIDKAKGLIVDDIPKHWTDYRTALEKDCGERGINCKLLIEDRPYFMRYRYKKYNKKYKDTISDFKKYEDIIWFTSDIDYKNTKEYLEMVDYCAKKTGLLKTNGIVNRICNYMESALEDIKTSQNSKISNEMFDILFNEDMPINEVALNDMLCIEKKYLDFKKTKCLSESEYNSWNQFFKSIRDECLSIVSNNIQECANLATYICYKLNPTKPKDFCWDCFGEGIILNIMKNIQYTYIPLLNENGDIYYLGNKYKQTQVNININYKDINDNEVSLYDSCDIFDDCELDFTI